MEDNVQTADTLASAPAAPTAAPAPGVPFLRTRAAGRRISLAGDPHIILASGDETNGAYAAIEVLVSPQNGPPLHTHTREDECFYILSGELTFTIAGRTHRAEAGTWVHAPRDIAHTYRNTGNAPARALVLVTPAGFEQFFLEVGQPLADDSDASIPPTPEQIARLVALAPKYGLRIHA
jgi:quercetin dioxygenase-like cupin family protein